MPCRNSWISLVVVGLAVAAVGAQAQTGFCTLGKVNERVMPMYPAFTDQNSRPIEGLVSLTATFAPDGKVTAARVLSGPQLLRFESENYVRGWRAEPSSEVRQCPIVLEYRFDGMMRECNSHAQIRIRAERDTETHVLMHLSCDEF